MIERYSLPEISRIWEDEFKFKTMLQIEILTLEALARQGKVPAAAVRRIRKKARFSIPRIRKIEENTQHDVVAFVKNVAQSIGADAKYLHYGLTSSDVLDTALGVQLKAVTAILEDDLAALRSVLARKAKQYKDMVCVGRTHGVHAEPTTFGLKVALWYDETRRNQKRLACAGEEVAVGKISGAVGTFANVDPRVEEYVCRKLRLKAAAISTQVIQRDVYAQYLATLATAGASLEKFATEIRHLQRTEVREVEEPFGKGQKGSSAMPHKRNPVLCERICGLSRILRANAMVAFENVALWHERDISHSSAERVILPDSTILLHYMLRTFIRVMEGLVVFPDNMLVNLSKSKGLIFSQRVLLALMEKGLPRMKAYDIVQRAAMRTWKGAIQFRDALLDEPLVCRTLSASEMDRLMDVDYFLRNLSAIYRRLGLSA